MFPFNDDNDDGDEYNDDENDGDDMALIIK